MSSRIAIGLTVAIFLLALGVAVLLAVSDKKAIANKFEIRLVSRTATPTDVTMQWKITGDRKWRVSEIKQDKGKQFVILRPGGDSSKVDLTITTQVYGMGIGSAAPMWYSQVTTDQMTTTYGQHYFETKVAKTAKIEKEVVEKVSVPRTFLITDQPEIAKIGPKPLVLKFIP